MRVVLVVVIGLGALILIGCAAGQRKLLYYPTHRADVPQLALWFRDKELIGVAREVPAPKTVWILLHGNAGQAADRTYALPCFPATDSVYILEYPGYGVRAGKPSLESFNRAAAEAYTSLRTRFPGVPICVAGESIGSGPACSLASQPVPPDKIVLAVPFDNLASVAGEHFPWLPVRLMLRDKWDNVEALKNYRGPVDVFAAEFDGVIPPQHARHLAESVPGAKFHLIPGGHNDWSRSGVVQFRFP